MTVQSGERLNELKRIFLESKLSEVFQIKAEEGDSLKGGASLRFTSNDYRIRAIELLEKNEERHLRVYHSSKMHEIIKKQINSINGQFKSQLKTSDFKGDFIQIASELARILNSKAIVNAASENPILTKNSRYEGLVLPDVDTSDPEVLGKSFNWKEIIAISEDNTDENKLRESLSEPGVYLQRSADGKARYVGSAYSNEGILARCLKHLNSNGDAKHLNLYILENGYENIEFTVLEFTSSDNVLKAEKRWKETLASKNAGPYDGYCLNSN